ncbi:MAG: aldo/keto reductase [Steroidobacteraceae bacterium]
MSPITGRSLPRGGVSFSPLGFGAAPIGNLFTKVADADAQAALQSAFEGGIRYFDTAPYYGYGLSERRVGQFLRGLQPENVTISTKVGRLISPGEAGAEPVGDYAASGCAVFDYSRDAVKRSFDSSLERLGLQRVDVLLLHDVGLSTHGALHSQMLQQALEAALPAMAEIKAMGGCRAIGIGVNEEAACLEIMRSFDIDCILLAGRYSILDHASLHGVMAEAQRRRVGIVVGGPYNSGLLANRSAPGGTYDYRPVEGDVLQRARQLYELCARLGVDVGAVALQFAFAHPATVAVLAGMRTPLEVAIALERMRQPVPEDVWQALRDAGFIAPEAPTPR